jgi:hypothetical protein
VTDLPLIEGTAAGTIVGAVVAGVIVYFLTRGNSAKVQRRERERVERVERAATALILLEELRLDEDILDGRIHPFLSQTSYGQDQLTMPTSGYDELRTSGKVSALGPDVANPIYRMFENVARVNAVLGRIAALPVP